MPREASRAIHFYSSPRWIASLPNQSDAPDSTFDVRLRTIGVSSFYVSYLQNRPLESIGNFFRVPHAVSVSRRNGADSLNIAAPIHIDRQSRLACRSDGENLSRKRAKRSFCADIQVKRHNERA